MSSLVAVGPWRVMTPHQSPRSGSCVGEGGLFIALQVLAPGMPHVLSEGLHAQDIFREYRKIKRLFPRTARAHSVVPPALPDAFPTPRRAADAPTLGAKQASRERSSTGARSCWASSGSRSARSAIEPLRSVNSTMTCLRSPSRALRDGNHLSLSDIPML